MGPGGSQTCTLLLTLLNKETEEWLIINWADIMPSFLLSRLFCFFNAWHSIEKWKGLKMLVCPKGEIEPRSPHFIISQERKLSKKVRGFESCRKYHGVFWSTKTTTVTISNRLAITICSHSLSVRPSFFKLQNQTVGCLIYTCILIYILFWWKNSSVTHRNLVSNHLLDRDHIIRYVTAPDPYYSISS